jgi:hypothetical protein
MARKPRRTYKPRIVGGKAKLGDKFNSQIGKIVDAAAIRLRETIAGPLCRSEF